MMRCRKSSIHLPDGDAFLCGQPLPPQTSSEEILATGRRGAKTRITALLIFNSCFVYVHIAFCKIYWGTNIYIW